ARRGTSRQSESVEQRCGLLGGWSREIFWAAARGVGEERCRFVCVGEGNDGLRGPSRLAIRAVKTWLLPWLLVCVATGAPIRFQGTPRELVISKVSERTIRIELLNI